jgi:hypothetical protein
MGIDSTSTSTSGPAQRDRALRRVRAATWAVGLAAAGLTGAFSAAAAHAFKGHSGKAAAAPAPTRHSVRVTVPPPQHVPPIGSQAKQEQPQPPASPPQSAPSPSAPPQAAPPQAAPPQAPPAQPAPAPAPPPVSSGGS